MGVDADVRRNSTGLADGAVIDFGCGRAIDVIDANGRTGGTNGSGCTDDVRIHVGGAVGVDAGGGTAQAGAVVDEGRRSEVIVDDADAGADSDTDRSARSCSGSTVECRMMIMQGCYI